MSSSSEESLRYLNDALHVDGGERRMRLGAFFAMASAFALVVGPLIAGVWLAAAQVPKLGLAKARTIVAGIALAAAGVLLIVATHWGHFG